MVKKLDIRINGDYPMMSMKLDQCDPSQIFFRILHEELYRTLVKKLNKKIPDVDVAFAMVFLNSKHKFQINLQSNLTLDNLSFSLKNTLKNCYDIIEEIIIPHYNKYKRIDLTLF